MHFAANIRLVFLFFTKNTSAYLPSPIFFSMLYVDVNDMAASSSRCLAWNWGSRSQHPTA